MVDYAPLDYFRQDEADAVLAALLLMGLHQEHYRFCSEKRRYVFSEVEISSSGGLDQVYRYMM